MNFFMFSASKRLAFVILLIVVSWTTYMLVIMPYADLVTGECSGTPGHDYAHAIFIIFGYFALFGYWIFRLFQQYKLVTRLLIIMFFLLLLPIFIAIIVTQILLRSAIIETIDKLNLYHILYTHGCYQELEIKDSFLLPIVAAITGLMLYLSLKSTHKNKAAHSRSASK